MNRILTVVCLVFLVPAAYGAPPAMDPLLPLAEHCWEGTFEGSEVSDRHCFEWLPGGHFLRDTHAIETEGESYRGETIFAVAGGSGEITYIYYNSLGGISRGSISMAEDGALKAEERYVGRGGNVQKYRSLLTFDDDGNGYRVASNRLIEGEWQAVRSIHYRRVD